MTNGLMFKDEASSLAAVELAIELRMVTREWLRLIREKHVDVDMALQAFENRGTAIIRAILRDTNPEVLGSVRRMEERLIWRIYCLLQTDPKTEMDFLKLLTELDKNPQFDSTRS